ncbi:MAG: STAS domain-containing protein [Clostridium sp.]|nr:STAS domain-containing protein [Clostridium sp.]
MTEVKTAPKISVAQAPELERALKAVLETGEDEIVINMEETVYMSSVGLRVFASIQKKVNASGRTMVLKNVRPQMKEIFEVTGFVGVLSFE